MLPPKVQQNLFASKDPNGKRLPSSADHRIVRIKKLCKTRSGRFLHCVEAMNHSPRTIQIKDLLDGFMYNRCQEWGSLFPETVRNSQSPINLISRDACYDRDLEKKGLRFNYFTSRETDILNNGHTLAVFPRAKQESLRHDSVGRSGLAGGPLPDETEYELAEIRFHWGRENNKGSEHTVNDKAFPMEVQLVHWNSQLYPCIEDAAGNPFGIAIVSLFAQIGREHSGLKIVTDNLEDVLYKGRQKTITSGFNPSCLLPDPSLRDFWVYDGSLTTPPCYEKVTWIIMRYPLMLSHSQIEEFRRLRTFSKGEYPRAGEDGIMVDNFRSIQKLAGRRVKASFQY